MEYNIQICLHRSIIPFIETTFMFTPHSIINLMETRTDSKGWLQLHYLLFEFASPFVCSLCQRSTLLIGAPGLVRYLSAPQSLSPALVLYTLGYLVSTLDEEKIKIEILLTFCASDFYFSSLLLLIFYFQHRSY